MAVVRIRRSAPAVVVIPASGEPLADAAALGAAGPVGDVAGAAAAPAGNAAAATAARLQFAIGAPVAIAVAWIAISFLMPSQPGGYRPSMDLKPDIGAFALFYFAAQAIERLLEPFAGLVLSTAKPKATRDALVAAAVNSLDADDATKAAEAQDQVDRLRGERALVLWAVASIVGMLVSAGLGLYFVSALVASNAPSWGVDILLTGLILGGGTKPVHDLISRVQKSKDNAGDPPETTGK